MERLLQKLHIRPKSPRVDNKIIASPPPIPVKQPSNDNPDLCSTCQDIWPEAISRKRKGWTGSRPIKYEDLKKTAVPAGECYPCYLFVQALGKLELNPNDQITHLDINAERLKGETMSLNAVITGSETREETLEFYCIQGCPTPFPIILPLTRISPNTGSDKAVTWAKGRLNACMTRHKSCAQPPKPPETPVPDQAANVLSSLFHHNPSNDVGASLFTQIMQGRSLHDSPAEVPDTRDLPFPETELPTRVLDLSGSRMGDVKLVESNGLRGAYACLSHCWGETKSIMTISSNLAEHFKTIPFSALPPTFKDAIYFARALGIQYMWIDSLCIIQDDRSDWIKEAAKMYSVYENALLTLGASFAQGDTAGCFTKSAKDDLIVFADPDEDHERPEWAIQVRRRLWHPEFFYPPRGRMNPMPLMNRAWVYQERLLSPRFLHFGPEELIWECAEVTTCECSTLLRLDRMDLERPKVDHLAVLQNASPRELMKRWLEMVTEYSCLRLSFPSDRLPALAGVAKQMSKFKNAKYLAGLWEDTLIQDMLWYSRPDGERLAAKPETWRAPSWSWVSVDDMVYHKKNLLGDTSDELQPLMAPIQKWCFPKSEDNEFGEVKEGGLMVVGGVTRIRLIRQESEDKGDERMSIKYGIRRHNVSEFLEFHPDWRWPDEHEWTLVRPSGHAGNDSAVSFERTKDDLYLLPTAQLSNSVIFLGLRERQSASPTVRAFERIGLGWGSVSGLASPQEPGFLDIT